MGSRMKLIGLAIACTLAGCGVGLIVKSDGLAAAVRDALAEKKAAASSSGGHDHGHADAPGEEHPDHVDLSEEAQKSLGLQVARLKLGTFTRHLDIPAVVAEKPGHSGRTIASRVQGIVERVYCSPGQLVRPGEKLFDVRLSGDAFLTAQASLLETLQQIETTRRELERVAELAPTGTVTGKQKIQLEYELKRLESQRSLRQQELVVRGLTPEQIADIVKSNRLLDELSIFVPSRKPNSTLPSATETAAAKPTITDGDSDGRDDFFTIESIDVHPGKSISPGDSMAHLAWHDLLYIEGHAFERDLDTLARIVEENKPITLEYGAREAPKLMTNLTIRFIDNHVDMESGTFRFFVEFQNQILHDATDNSGQSYRSWRFKPGQRLHLKLPVSEIHEHFVLPLAAVVQEGVNAYVFRVAPHNHDHSGDSHTAHKHDHSGMELHQVPVSIVMQDTQQVVVATGGDLKVGDKVAINSAYQLRQALRSDSGSGHAHGHEH